MVLKVLEDIPETDIVSVDVLLRFFPDKHNQEVLALQRVEYNKRKSYQIREKNELTYSYNLMIFDLTWQVDDQGYSKTFGVKSYLSDTLNAHASKNKVYNIDYARRDQVIALMADQALLISLNRIRGIGDSGVVLKKVRFSGIIVSSPVNCIKEYKGVYFFFDCLKRFKMKQSERGVKGKKIGCSYSVRKQDLVSVFDEKVSEGDETNLTTNEDRGLLGESGFNIEDFLG